MTHFSVTPVVLQTPANLFGVNCRLRADANEFVALFDFDPITPMLHTEGTFGGIDAKPSVPIDGHHSAGPEDLRDPAVTGSTLVCRIKLVQHRFDCLASVWPRRTDQPAAPRFIQPVTNKPAIGRPLSSTTAPLRCETVPRP